MRFKLRTLLILLALTPPLLAWGYQVISQPAAELGDLVDEDTGLRKVYFGSFEEYEEWSKKQTPEHRRSMIAMFPSSAKTDKPPARSRGENNTH